MNSTIIPKAAKQMANLPYNLQEMVLKFIERLTLFGKSGVSGSSLLKYAGFISPDDLKIMSDVIENDCRKIDTNEW